MANQRTTATCRISVAASARQRVKLWGKLWAEKLRVKGFTRLPCHTPQGRSERVPFAAVTVISRTPSSL